MSPRDDDLDYEDQDAEPTMTAQKTNRTFRIEQVAGGYQMLSLPEYGDILKRLHQREADAKLQV